MVTACVHQYSLEIIWLLFRDLFLINIIRINHHNKIVCLLKKKVVFLKVDA